MNITLILVAIISVMANIIQFFLNKKSNDIKNLQNRIDLMDKVQEQQTKVYDSESKRQNDKIISLQNKIENQDKLLKQNADEIMNLRRLVTKLIGDGCHINNCENRAPYTVDEISEMTKNRENEKTSIKHNK